MPVSSIPTIRKALIYAIPCLVAAVLCVPCLSLGYFWDDYHFLTSRVSGLGSGYLLPNPDEAFYRPIPQGLYFLLLRLIDPENGTLAHVLNLTLLLCAVTLLVALVSRLSGRRAGLISGLVFACLGCAPNLVAWVSCSQDLFAIVFVLAAFLLRQEGRDVPAIACATAALFSKEPAIAAFPVLILWDRLVGRVSARPRLQFFAYLGVILTWILIHPGVRSLAARGFQSGASSYLGVTQPEQWARNLARYAMTLANIPPMDFANDWWEGRIGLGILALGFLIAGFLYLDRSRPGEGDLKPLPLKRIALIGALFGIPTLLAPIVLVRHWAPYFACIPAVGLAIVAGPALVRHRAPVVIGVLATFLVCGVWYRGTRSEREPAWTEWVFAGAARATKLVRANFKTALPALPRGSQVVASVSPTGVQGIYNTLLEGQALRVWYADPTLNAITTQTRRHGAANEFLVRITPGLHVIAINFDTGQVRTTVRGQPDLVESELGRPILNYARAVAAEGNTPRALRITGALAYSPTSEIYARRLAAMILLGAGRSAEASRLLEETPALPRQVALDFVLTMLKEASYDERLDEAAFQAFGLSGSDPETIRWIMRAFQRDGLWRQAAWYAQRLRRLAPEDRESADLLSIAQRMGIGPNRMP